MCKTFPRVTCGHKVLIADVNSVSCYFSEPNLLVSFADVNSLDEFILRPTMDIPRMFWLKSRSVVEIGNESTSSVLCYA